MPSEYQKWIARDVKPEETRELTKQEQRANWWYYHRKHVIVGLVILAIVLWAVWDTVRAKSNLPDCQLAYIGTGIVPDDTIAALEEQLAPLVGDVDGNGKFILKVTQYPVDPSRDDCVASDPNQQMAMFTQLTVNENFFFLVEDPGAFQERYHLLTYADGTPEELEDRDEPLWYPWVQCPQLAQLPLGDYEIELVGGESITGSSQEFLSELYIGRSIGESWSEEENAVYTEIWKKLLQGTAESPFGS